MSGVGNTGGSDGSKPVVDNTTQPETTTSETKGTIQPTTVSEKDTSERVSRERRKGPPGVNQAFGTFVPGADYRRGDLVRGVTEQPSLALTQNYFFTTFGATDQAAIHSIMAKGKSVTQADLDQIVEIVGRQENTAAALSALYWQFKYVDNHSGIETWSAMEYLARQSGVCRDTANFNTYVLTQFGVEARSIGYASAGGINHAVTLYKDPTTNKWTLLEYTRGGHQDAGVYFDTIEEALGTLLAGSLKHWAYDPVSSARPGDAASIYWTDFGLELDNFFVNRNVARPGNAGRNGQWYATAAETSITASADFGKFSIDLRHYYPGAMSQIDGSFFVAGRYGSESDDGRLAGSVSLFAGHMPNTWYLSVGPRRVHETSTTVFGLGFEARATMLDFDLTRQRSLRFTSHLDTSGALVGAFDHEKDATFDLGVAGGLSYWDMAVRNQLTWEATRGVDLWLAHTTHVPIAESVVNIASSGRVTLANLPISNFAEVGSRLRLGSFENETALYVPIDTESNNLFANELRLSNTLQYSFTEQTRGVLNVHGDLNGFGSLGANLGVRHGNLLGAIGYERHDGNDFATFNLGISF